MYGSTTQPINLSIYLAMHRINALSIYRSINLLDNEVSLPPISDIEDSIYLCINLLIYKASKKSAGQSINLSISPTIDLPTYRPIDLPT